MPGPVNVAEFASAAADNGWTEADADRDIFGDYRSAAWRSPKARPDHQRSDGV
jgi:hypothetical protein